MSPIERRLHNLGVMTVEFPLGDRMSYHPLTQWTARTVESSSGIELNGVMVNTWLNHETFETAMAAVCKGHFIRAETRYLVGLDLGSGDDGVAHYIIGD